MAKKMCKSKRNKKLLKSKYLKILLSKGKQTVINSRDSVNT